MKTLTKARPAAVSSMQARSVTAEGGGERLQ